MAIENEKQAFREGRAVMTMAESIMRKTGAEGKPLSDTIGIAFNVIETNQTINPNNAELLIESLNTWADIKDVVGEENANQLADVQEEALGEFEKEVTEFLKGEREIEGVLEILEEAVGENEIGGRILKEHPEIKPQLVEYQRMTLMLAKAAV